MFKILKREMLTPNICKMVVSAPRIAKAAKPGQFLIVLANEEGERIPLTISDYDREGGTVTIVTQLIGASSAAIIAKAKDTAGDGLSEEKAALEQQVNDMHQNARAYRDRIIELMDELRARLDAAELD